MKKLLVILVLSLASFAGAARAGLLSSTISNYSEYDPFLSLGKGDAHVTLYWSSASTTAGWGYVYGTGFSSGNSDTDVALATGIMDIAQIKDASSYTFTDSVVRVNDSGFGGWGERFVVLHNKISDTYGVLRIDDIHSISNSANPGAAFLDATWWVDVDHGVDFSAPVMLSPVPEPSFYGICGTLMLGGLVAYRRVRNNLSRRMA